MIDSTDEQFGGGFAEVRDGDPIVPVIRPEEEPHDAPTP